MQELLCDLSLATMFDVGEEILRENKREKKKKIKVDKF